MTSLQLRTELHRQIWKIANDIHGSTDGWDFKQYVLGALFYRFISEHFANDIEADDGSIRPSNQSVRLIKVKCRNNFFTPT